MIRSEECEGRVLASEIRRRPVNKYHESYGLLVTTRRPPRHVMLVERKIPYCLQNALVSRFGAIAASLNRRVRDEESTRAPETIEAKAAAAAAAANYDDEGDDDAMFLRLLVSNAILACTRDSNLNDADFSRYRNKRVFEDQFDFPHGQMTAKTKHLLNEYRRVRRKDDEGEKSDGKKISAGSRNSSPTYEFLEKTARFLTAFNEFEEETSFTFRFDMHAILKAQAYDLSFDGLDGFEYKQTFYLVRVDKLKRLFRNRRRPRYGFDFGTTARADPSDVRETTNVDDDHDDHDDDEYNNGPRSFGEESAATAEPRETNDARVTLEFNFQSSKKRRQKIFQEFDRQTYLPRLVDVEEAIGLLVRQQSELDKRDFKYKMLSGCLDESSEGIASNKNNSKRRDGCDEKKTCEDHFFDFVEKVAPDISKRCLKRVRRRDATDVAV